VLSEHSSDLVGFPARITGPAIARPCALPPPAPSSLPGEFGSDPRRAMLSLHPFLSKRCGARVNFRSKRSQRTKVTCDRIS
jgi:hypothetical protein